MISQKTPTLVSRRLWVFWPQNEITIWVWFIHTCGWYNHVPFYREVYAVLIACLWQKQVCFFSIISSLFPLSIGMILPSHNDITLDVIDSTHPSLKHPICSAIKSWRSRLEGRTIEVLIGVIFTFQSLSGWYGVEPVYNIQQLLQPYTRLNVLLCVKKSFCIMNSFCILPARVLPQALQPTCANSVEMFCAPDTFLWTGAWRLFP